MELFATSGHPNHYRCCAPEPCRNVRPSIRALHKEAVASSLADLPVDSSATKTGFQRLHQRVDVEEKRSYHHPVLLGGYPPPIAASERHFPRVTRCALAQLRSGYCMLLRQYQHRLDPSISDCCPDCGVSPHDCRHLFACSSRPGTHLTPADLGLKPVEVAAFLRLPTTPSLDSGGDS